jgi:hypothetical protein
VPSRRPACLGRPGAVGSRLGGQRLSPGPSSVPSPVIRTAPHPRAPDRAPLVTVTFWIFLALVTAALAAATALRRRPAPRPPEVDRLPGRDDLAGLGLSEVRAVSSARPAAPVAVAVARPVATPVSARATPARQEAATAEASPSNASGWIDDLLDDEHPQPAVATAVPEPVSATSVPETPAETPAETSDEAVWTFDHSAAETAEPVAGPDLPSPGRSFYVRDGQALWPEDATPAALLAASLAARLGGSVAVVRHDGPSYVVELLAGPAGASAHPEPMPADGHPLHAVPRTGDLTLLDDGDRHALTYLADPEAAVGQVLAGALTAPPHPRVLLVADLPPGAPEVDEATAVLVGHYADLLADLSHAPAGDGWGESDEDGPADAADGVEAEMTETGPEPTDSAEPGDVGGSAEDDSAATDEAAGTTSEPAADRAADRAAPATVARPSRGRTEPVPPPRGVILSAEIAAARDARRPLVFALVTLADAEAVLRGGVDDVARAEAALRKRLSAAPTVRRVEPFGDLLLGAFLDAEGPEVAAWAARLSSAGPALLVGAVPAAGSPDVVRATATAALQSAYEQEAVCVVAS